MASPSPIRTPRRRRAADRRRADWCVCTIPLSILSQIQINVGAPMKAAIDAGALHARRSRSGCRFKRRFWEEDEAIYGGITYHRSADPQIGYPCTGYFHAPARACCLGAYHLRRLRLRVRRRCRRPSAWPSAVEWGARIHPQYQTEFENGVAVAWHRMPVTSRLLRQLERGRAQAALRRAVPDRRPHRARRRARVYLPAWQEGAILSALDAIARLHDRVVKT